VGLALGISWGEAMSREPIPGEVDLTESGDVVSTMSAAVGRLRLLAAAAFNAGPGEAEDWEVPTTGE